MAKLVSKTYGEALFELALETDTLETCFEEVHVIKNAFSENLELFKILNHPEISNNEKTTIIENIFKGKVSDSMVGFLLIIIQKRRYNDLEDILLYVISRIKEYKNIGVAYIKSAVELTDIQKEQTKNRLIEITKHIEIEMNYQTDPSLIGGMVIRIGDRVVDSSIKSKIASIAKDLSNIQLA